MSQTTSDQQGHPKNAKSPSQMDSHDKDDDAWTRIPDDRPFLKRVNWPHAVLLTLTPILAVYGAFTTPVDPRTAVFALFWYLFCGLGITAGYHRMWAHKAYKGQTLYRFGLALAGAGAIQGSIRWWCRGHRAHHRYTDTNKDPYSAKRGMLWAHLGWLYTKPHPRDFGRVDLDDLRASRIVDWQHKYYIPLAATFGIILPTIIPWLGWDDPRGGYFYAAILRMVILHHSTFAVNSVAHYLGEATYDDRFTPRDSFFTAILTLGEGYHNFHHEFPYDYRNAIRFYQYDPTKWFIRSMSCLGLTYGLRRFDENEIQKGKLLMVEKKAAEQRKSLQWGSPVSELPEWTREKYESRVKDDGCAYILISRLIYDVSSFLDEHPGGKRLLLAHLGRDATNAFNGGIYDHNNAARNLLSQFRIAKLSGATDEDALGRGNLQMPEYGKRLTEAAN